MLKRKIIPRHFKYFKVVFAVSKWSKCLGGRNTAGLPSHGKSLLRLNGPATGRNIRLQHGRSFFMVFLVR
jgi:hypothetical protein